MRRQTFARRVPGPLSWRSTAPLQSSRALPKGEAWRASPQLAQCLSFKLVGYLRGQRAATAGFQAVFDQLAQALLGLVFLIAPDQFAQVFAGVAVLPGPDALVNIAAQGFRKCKAHGVGAHACTIG